MAAEGGEDDEDPVIRAERAHLVQSRDYLRVMREEVLAINPMAADPVSLEFLKADLYLRAEFVGMMLGLQPKAAATAVRRLHGMGVVEYADETLAILDLQTLAELACECYVAQSRLMPGAR